MPGGVRPRVTNPASRHWLLKHWPSGRLSGGLFGHSDRGVLAMPMGQELWLGVTGDDARLACNAILGTPFKTEKQFLRELSDLDDEAIASHNGALDACYTEALRALGLTPLSTKGDYLVVQTPLGKRQMSGWTLGLQYDPDEVGDEHATLGVGLSGRYFPTLLDWRDPHGTLMGGLDLRATIKEAELVIPIIHRELPFTADWKLLLVDIFY